MIDSHAHLYFDRFDEDRAEVIARARAAGIGAIINIGIDLATSQQAVALAAANAGFYAAVGLHPASKITDMEAELAGVERLAIAERGRVVAVGEIGLDYYWKDVSPGDQAPRLERQLDLATRLGLPVVFHCRDALEALLAALEARSSRPPGVFHCFSGGTHEAERALALGYHVSFAGNVTFPRSVELQAALGAVPLERLLLETDCPFLAPQPVRGRRNEPAFVQHTRDFIARTKGVPPEEVERATDAAARQLFRLPG